MQRTFTVLSLAAGALLCACSPTFNWRDVRAEAGDLVALMPCKPDRVVRTIPLAGTPVDMEMLGCDAGDATFAVASATLPDAGRAGQALGEWKAATLRNLRGTQVKETPFVPANATALPQAVRVEADGRLADDSAVTAHAAWFARGTRLYHAVVYSDRRIPDVADTFFAGLRLP